MGGRWRAFEFDELAKRDKLNLDVNWLKDRSLEDNEDLPEPGVLAAVRSCLVVPLNTG